MLRIITSKATVWFRRDAWNRLFTWGYANSNKRSKEKICALKNWKAGYQAKKQTFGRISLRNKISRNWAGEEARIEKRERKEKRIIFEESSKRALRIRDERVISIEGKTCYQKYLTIIVKILRKNLKNLEEWRRCKDQWILELKSFKKK